MKISVRYLILAVLVLGIFTALIFTVPAPLIYSLEQDSFISHYHDNTDVLKLQQLNSTTDLLPLMQDLMDYTGPIVLNINLRDMDQVRRDLALFAKYRKNLDNLIIRLDMSESEINEFSKNTDLQRALLEELMKASISLDELKQLEIQYRSENNQNMLISVILQQAAIRQKLKELFGQYETATEKIEAISKKYNLDTTNVEESRTEFKKIVEENTKTAPIIGSQTLQVPTLSLLLKPDTGKYQDVIELSAFYSSTGIQKNNYPITIFVDNNPVIQSSTDAGGIYHSSYVIEKIPAGTHLVNATSGSTASEPRILNIIQVNSTTTLTVKAVSNKPEVQCSGVITANKPVKNAPVDIISDARSIISTTTNNAGQFQSRITLSPGTHRLEARFDNASYPISSSRSPVYEIVVASTFDAPEGKVQSVKPITVVRNADTLWLSITPNNATYKDIINISGTLSGRDPKFRNVDVFIDDALYRTVQTRQDGSYAESYVIEKIQPGLHTIFTRYLESGVEEIYSESRQFTVYPVDSITLLEIEMIDAGTGLICRGNLTAQGRGVSSAPLELVWDDRNIIKLQTDATGSFRQQVTLPVGNHNIYANFTSRDYPVKASRSKTSPVTILPPFDLYVRPSTVHFMEQLSIGGSFRGVNTSGREVQIFINGKKLGSYRTDARGNYSTQFPVEKIPAGTHRVYASSGDHTSETESFTVLLVNSTITLSARLTTDNTEVICSGQLRTGDNTPVRLAPVTLVRDGNNPIRTTTDDQGRFEETLSLPAGRHQLIAVFDNTELYPIQPSKSVPVNIEIPNPIIIRVQPDRGMYRDTLTISGVIHGMEVSGRVLQMYIDSKETGTFRSDSRGNFTAPYTIEQLRGGVHTIHVKSGDIRSDSINFTVALVQSTTTLSAVRTGETSRVTCSGTVTANNKPVRFAPVVLVWDDKNFIRTTTDMNGNYNETIVLPAGKHRIKAQFNSPDTFPINPSESAPVDVEIPLPLLILIEPNQGRYMDVLSIKGSLHTDEIAQQEIQITIDGKLTGSARTDNNGRFTIPYTLEKITGGTHTVYARYKEVSSDKGTFTVLLSDSTTILSATRVKETSRVTCSGTVTANNKPVRLAPVVLVWDEKNIVRTTTDENGKYNETIVLPAGKHRINAQFNSPDTLPINPSESAPVDVEIPLPLLISIQPNQGRYMDVLSIKGSLHADEIANKEIQIVIDGKLTGSTRTDNNGYFTSSYTLEKIADGNHSVYARYKEVSSERGTFMVLLSDSITTLAARKTINTSQITCTGTVTANNKPVRLAPVVLVWDEKNIVRTTTDENGKYNETIVLPAGKHRIKAQFNSPDGLPINPSESAVVIIEIPQIITIGNLVLEVMPKEGRFMDHITIRGILSNNNQNRKSIPTTVNSPSPVGTQAILEQLTTGGKGVTSLDITNEFSVNKKTPVVTHPETNPIQEISGESVFISIDGKLLGTYRTNSNGEFFTEYIIEKIRAGLHTVYAMSGEIQSNPETFTVIAENTTTTLSAAKIGNTSRVTCSGSVTANNNPVRSVTVSLVWDDMNIVRTTTDEKGHYTETIVLPPGKHQLKAQFNSTNIYPLYPSESAPVDLEIPLPLGFTVQPNQGRYLDILYIQGTLHTEEVAEREIQIFIDGKPTGTHRTDRQGTFTIPYTIEKITGGQHIVFAKSGDIQTNQSTFTVLSENTTTTLSATKIGNTSLVSCTGTVTANNKPVRLAPVTLLWDNTNTVRTITDEYGNYNETIVLPPGKHQLKAQFNSTNIYPLYPSESAPVYLEIPLPLGFTIQPNQGRYLDILYIQGALHAEVVAEREIQIFIDGKLSGTHRTDRQGTFTIPYTIEKITGGQHIIFAKSGDIQTNQSTFTVLAENSTTTLSAVKIGETSLVFCSGTITANNKPVRSAPVTLVWDGSHVVNSITDQNGDYNETIALPAGKHQLKAQFNSTNIFPLYPSESAPVEVEILTPLSITIQPDHGKYRDVLAINGSLNASVISNRDIRIFIDDRQAGSYRTDTKGHFSTMYSIEKITGGKHTIQAIAGDLKSTPTPFVVLMDNSTTTLSAQRIGTTAQVTVSGTVNTTNRSVRGAPVTITWDGKNSLETITDNNGVYRDFIILPAGTHHIQAQFNNSNIFPLYPSNSTMFELNISPGLSLDVRPASGIYKDTLTFEGTLVRPDNLEGAVDLFLDNNFLATIKTDRTGRYIHKMVIEQVPDGKHTVQARSTDLSSGVRTFTVIPVQSRTTLTVTRVNNSALFECNGTVMAFDRSGDVILRPLSIQDVLDIIATFGRVPLATAKRPVSAAPVALMVNNVTLLEMQTDAFGRFSRVVALPADDNIVTARFVNNRFPLVPSQSKEIAVNLPSANLSPLENIQSSPSGMLVPVIVVAVILLVFTGGSIFYLKRRSILFRTRRTPAALNSESETLASAEMLLKEIEAADSFLASVLPPDPGMVSTDPILTRYIRILNTQGLSTAARTVYVHFAGTIAQRLHIRSHRTLTPREFLRSCDRRPFAGTFSSFVTIYEQVRYGGVKSPDKEVEFKEATKKTDESLGGEED